MSAFFQFFSSVPLHLHGVILYALWGSVKALKNRAVLFQQFCFFHLIFPIWAVTIFREIFTESSIMMAWGCCAMAGIAYGWKWGTATAIDVDHKAKTIILPRSKGVFGLIVFFCVSFYVSRLFKNADAQALIFVTRVGAPLALGMITGRGLALIRKYRKLTPSGA